MYNIIYLFFCLFESHQDSLGQRIVATIVVVDAVVRDMFPKLTANGAQHYHGSCHAEQPLLIGFCYLVCRHTKSDYKKRILPKVTSLKPLMYLEFIVPVSFIQQSTALPTIVCRHHQKGPLQLRFIKITQITKRLPYLLPSTVADCHQIPSMTHHLQGKFR